MEQSHIFGFTSYDIFHRRHDMVSHPTVHQKGVIYAAPGPNAKQSDKF